MTSLLFLYLSLSLRAARALSLHCPRTFGRARNRVPVGAPLVGEEKEEVRLARERGRGEKKGGAEKGQEPHGEECAEE